MEYLWKTRVSALAAAVLTITGLLLAACGDGSEATASPDVRGEVTNRTNGAGETLGVVLIVGELEEDTSHDRASVRIDADTEIYRSEGGELVAVTWGDLAEGQRVEAWFEGLVAESYPVQAYARQVVITG